MPGAELESVLKFVLIPLRSVILHRLLERMKVNVPYDVVVRAVSSYNDREALEAVLGQYHSPLARFFWRFR